MQIVSLQAFQPIGTLEELISSHFKFCCLADWIPSDKCFPQLDVFSSCADLMSRDILRFFLWIMGILGFIGNSCVILWRTVLGRIRDKERPHSLIITSLAVADFLMSIYLLIIASVDTYYRGRYSMNDEHWRFSIFCNIAGVIATTSCQVQNSK